MKGLFMQTYHYLLSFDKHCESHVDIKGAVHAVLSLEDQKYMCEKTDIKRFLTYLDKYQEQFKNKSYFLLAFYMLGYINKNTSLIMEEYSKQIGLVGFNYEKIETILHQFVFDETQKREILLPNFHQVLRKFKTVFDSQDFDMAKIIDFVKQEYIESQYNETLDNFVDLFKDYLINNCLNMIQNTNVVFTNLITKMQKSLNDGILDVQLYKDNELDNMNILPITNYRIQRIKFFG